MMQDIVFQKHEPSSWPILLQNWTFLLIPASPNGTNSSCLKQAQSPSIQQERLTLKAMTSLAWLRLVVTTDKALDGAINGFAQKYWPTRSTTTQRTHQHRSSWTSLHGTRLETTQPTPSKWNCTTKCQLQPSHLNAMEQQARMSFSSMEAVRPTPKTTPFRSNGGRMWMVRSWSVKASRTSLGADTCHEVFTKLSCVSPMIAWTMGVKCQLFLNWLQSTTLRHELWSKNWPYSMTLTRPFWFRSVPMEVVILIQLVSRSQPMEPGIVQKANQQPVPNSCKSIGRAALTDDWRQKTKIGSRLRLDSLQAFTTLHSHWMMA